MPNRLTIAALVSLALLSPAAFAQGVAAADGAVLIENVSADAAASSQFAGTIAWTEGTDEMSRPTLIGTADIASRGLAVQIVVRKNADPSLPATAIAEITFTTGAGFAGGSVSALPGILVKDETIAGGAALVGASARIVGNSFLFALSNAPADASRNTELLTKSSVVDLPIVYENGLKAMVTMPKDEAAQALFRAVLEAWAKPGNG